MFKKILFAANASPACDAAAKVAFELSEKYQSDLTLLHVLHESSHGSAALLNRDATGGKNTADTHDLAQIKTTIKKRFAGLIQKHKEPGIKVLAGIPSREILSYALKKGMDCIIMGGHGSPEDPAGTRFRGVVGATVQKVALKAGCPVMIVSRPCETCFWYFNPIVFGTDFSAASMGAFQFAYKLAGHIGCKLHLFHALNIETTQAGVAQGQKSIEDRIKEAKAKIQRRYVARMADFDNYEVSVWEGVPYVELLKFAREKSCDLIVMAHHARAVEVEGAVMGSTVEQVVLRSACPVASVNITDHLYSD